MHIQDSSFYDVLYATNRPAAKRKDLDHRFNNPKAAFSTSDHALHRLRRSALNPFFSKRAISERAPIIQKHIDAVCRRLKSEFQNTGRILVVNEMWGCWNTDIIIEYCFERRYNFIYEPNFKSPFVKSMMDLLDGVHWVTQFPGLVTMMNWMPDTIVGRMDTRMKNVIKFNEVRFFPKKSGTFLVLISQ